MKAVFIGCVLFSGEMLRYALSLNHVHIVGVVTKKESDFNADFYSLESEALANQIPCFIYENNEIDLCKWVENLNPDVIFCFGWSHLLKKELIKTARLGVIGHHPAELPKNRGRHPVIWALVLGLDKTASTFFFIDEGVDNGAILNQKIISINFEDTAGSLYKKIIETAKAQFLELSLELNSGRYLPSIQNENDSNVWRKRTVEDGQIDWRMSSVSIYNLIRALTHPYVGAHCRYKKKDVKIWKSSLENRSGGWNIEPGKVINIEGSDVIIKCGYGYIRLVDHDFCPLPERGSYL